MKSFKGVIFVQLTFLAILLLLIFISNIVKAEPAISIVDDPKDKDIIIVSCIKDDNKEQFLKIKRNQLESRIVVDWMVETCF